VGSYTKNRIIDGSVALPALTQWVCELCPSPGILINYKTLRFLSQMKGGDTYSVGTLTVTGPSTVGVSVPSSESGNRSCFRNFVFSSYFEFWKMGEAHKSRDTEFYKPPLLLLPPLPLPLLLLPLLLLLLLLLCTSCSIETLAISCFYSSLKSYCLVECITSKELHFLFSYLEKLQT
jgi:hypothetical protein